MTNAVIFDIDGTLLDSAGRDDLLYRRAVNQVLGEVRFRSDLSDYDHVTDTGILLQVLNDNAVPLKSDTVDKVKKAFFDLLDAHIVKSGPFPEIAGAKEFIGRLMRSDSHKVAIATGGWRQSAEMKLRAAEFNVDGIPLATSDDARQRVTIMRTALESIAAEFQSITYFGDGIWDQRACKKLGWTFRGVGPALNGLLSYDKEFVT